MPDSDVWRSVICHHNELANLRSVFFSRLALTDPKSEARSRPAYDKELLAWRAQLRPFLVAPDGSEPTVRPLESMSGSTLNQQAVEMFNVGEDRRKTLYREHFKAGWIPKHRSRQDPVMIVAGEAEVEEESFDDLNAEDCTVYEEIFTSDI